MIIIHLFPSNILNFSKYLILRVFYGIAILFAISFIVFLIVQIPQGDAVDKIVAAREAEGDIIDENEQLALRKLYGLDRPIIIQYADSLVNFIGGEMGRSMLGVPVNELVKERIGETLLLAFLSLFITYIVAIPIAIYSATHQYSIGDYLLTFLGFIGLATPNFLLALILLFLFNKYFGLSIGGLFSPEYEESDWSLLKLWDLIKHLWIPIIVIATANTAGTIRTMRATLLDELGKQYVITAKAKGLTFNKLLYKYPVRLALNPIINSLGHILPVQISGQTITAIVLNLPTLGPLLFNSLLAEDVQTATSVLMILSIISVAGVILADIALTIYDPRIRMDKEII